MERSAGARSLKSVVIFVLTITILNIPAIILTNSASAGSIASDGLIINYDHSSFTSDSSTLTNLVPGETNATLRGSNSTLRSPTSVGQSTTRNYFTTTSGLGDNYASANYIYTNTGLPASKFDTSTVSAFAWVYPTTSNHVVLEERGSAWNATADWYDTQIEMVEQKYSFRVWNCSAITAPSTSTLNAWHYVGFTFNGSTMKAYVDGVQVSTDLSCTRELPWTGSTRLLYYGVATNRGTDLNASSNNYGGFNFGALHIYKRSISASEVSGNYSTKLSQSIVFSGLGTSSKIYPYSQSLNMTTSGTSGAGAVSFAITGGTASGCALSNATSTATITSNTAGTCLVTASIASDTFFDSASSSALEFSFSKASQVLSFATTSFSKTFGETQTVTATSAGTGAITYSVGASTACTVAGSTVTITASSGTCSVTATRATDVNYLEATSSNSVTITVSKAVQANLTLTSTSTPFLTNLSLVTTGGSGSGALSYSVSSSGTAGCSVINGDSLTSTSAGTCVIVVRKETSTNYLDAYDTQTVTISKATLVLTTSVASTLKYGSSTMASYSSNRSLGVGSIPAISGSLAYETSTTTACDINGSTGSITMKKASGSCNIRVRLSNDSNYLDTTSAIVSITPAQADAITITAENKTSIFNGAAASITPTYSVSGLQFQDTVTVTYGYTGVSNAGDLYSFSSTKPTEAGLYSIIPLVTLTNSESYTTSASTNSGTLTIARASRTLSPTVFSKDALKYGESATVTSNVTSPSTNQDGEFLYTVGAGCSIDSSSGTITATQYSGYCLATTTIQQGNNYESAAATPVSFALSKADTITVTASSPAAVTYTGSAAAITPTVSVNGLVSGDTATGATFSYSRAPSCASGGTCLVGDTGPGGGKVFYISGSQINAAPGIGSGGIYLEMAPASFSKTTYNWCEGPGNPYTTLFGATATTIGSGAANTKIMVDNCTGGAGVQAANLTLGGQSDWFLPSYGELVEIYNQRTMLGLGTGKYASTYLYWSSTEADYWIASSLVPWAGVGGQNKAQGTPFLPIRAFSPTSSTYESPISAPVNAGLYQITPSALTLAAGITTDYYVATVYEPGALTINKAAQNPFTNYSTLSGIFGITFPVVEFGGSGNGAESIETTNGSATGCALSGNFLSASSSGTCSVAASKESSENYLEYDSLFSVNFFYYVPEPVAPVSTMPTQIAISAKNTWSVNATAGPAITSISPSSGPVGTVITITGTSLDGVDVIKIGRKLLTSITGVSSTSMTAVIPSGATTGPIMISNSYGGDFYAAGFTVTP